MGNDWTKEYQQALKTSLAFRDFFHDFYTTEELSELCSVIETYSFVLPLRIAKKIKLSGKNSSLAKQFLPQSEELTNTSGLYDPIGDKSHAQGGQLIHRYDNRALFTPTTVCPVMCRYCFRKNELNAKDEVFAADFERTLNYLQAHPEIEEIIFTGGDPLVLSNEKLIKYIMAFSEIKTIKYLRFHTRFVSILPSRIDEGLVQILKDAASKFESVIFGVHINHMDEFDAEVEEAFLRLKNLPIQLVSQSVLLKDVNDSEDHLIPLFKKLVSLGCRPYYLHHPDQVKGGMHFSLSLEEGRMIYAKLRKKLPGWALPHYIIDIPGGHGKVSAFNPETYSFSNELISLNGNIVSLS